MLIEKTFTVQHETYDPAIIYSAEPNEMVKREMSRKYAGKCYKGCLVLEVIDIIRRSPFVSDHERTGGAFLYSVAFSVRALVYHHNEVIPRAELRSIMDDGLMIFNAEHTSISIEPNPRLSHLKVGDATPLIVIESSYQPMSSSVVVAAIPFVPRPDTEESYVVSVTDDTVSHLQRAPVTDIKGLSDTLQALYPYTEPVAVPKNAEVVRMNAITKGSYTVSRPSWLLDPWSILIAPVSGGAPVHAGHLFRGWIQAATERVKLAEALAAFPGPHWDLYRSMRLPYKGASETPSPPLPAPKGPAA